MGIYELLPCERAICSETDAVCVVELLPDGADCADGLLCTGPDSCLNGACRGTPLDCDDGDPCTSDSCDEKDGCVYAPLSDTPCDDGDACTAVDVCIAGAVDVTAIEGAASDALAGGFRYTITASGGVAEAVLLGPATQTILRSTWSQAIRAHVQVSGLTGGGCPAGQEYLSADLLVQVGYGPPGPGSGTTRP